MAVLFNTFLPDDEATNRFGIAIAPLVNAGDVILLNGEIGSGKTHFARALIQERLRLEGQPETNVPSPTFTLIQTYDMSNVEIWHADLYRLGDTSEVAELGLDIAMGTQICIIEWPERLGFHPDGALVITFEVRPNGRHVTVSADSTRWTGLADLPEVQNA